MNSPSLKNIQQKAEKPEGAVILRERGLEEKSTPGVGVCPLRAKQALQGPTGTRKGDWLVPSGDGAQDLSVACWSGVR